MVEQQWKQQTESQRCHGTSVTKIDFRIVVLMLWLRQCQKIDSAADTGARGPRSWLQLGCCKAEHYYCNSCADSSVTQLTPPIQRYLHPYLTLTVLGCRVLQCRSLLSGRWQSSCQLQGRSAQTSTAKWSTQV